MIKPFIRGFEKLASRSRILSGMYMLPYRRLVRREGMLAQLTNDDTVLVVGGGSIPFTPILLTRFFGVDVHTIDIDPHAIKRARRILDRMGLASKVKVSLHDGTKPFGEPYDVALLTLQAEPKPQILKQLRSDMKRTRILARVADPRYQRFYEAFPDDIKVSREVEHRFLAIGKTIYMETE